MMQRGLPVIKISLLTRLIFPNLLLILYIVALDLTAIKQPNKQSIKNKPLTKKSPHEHRYIPIIEGIDLVPTNRFITIRPVIMVRLISYFPHCLWPFSFWATNSSMTSSLSWVRSSSVALPFKGNS